MYKDKLCTAEEAAAKVESGFVIDYGFFNGKPVAFDKALAARKDELKDVQIWTAVTLPPDTGDYKSRSHRGNFYAQ